MAVEMHEIQSESEFLVKDPKHEHEKPYQLRYDVGEDFPETNMTEERKPILVRDFRPLQNARSLYEYGFTSAKLSRSFTAADFGTNEEVVESYYPAIEEVLRQSYPDANEIKILEHDYRKRHAQFPNGENFENQQPSVLAHIDFTMKSAARTAEAAFKIAPDRYRRLVTVNFWKSFQGPGNDWPLAVCDRRTFRRGHNSSAVDVVYHDSFTENESMHHSPEYRWYYFKDLRDDEVIVFVQTDSDEEGGGGVPHVSFFNPEADDNALPRRSIEVRAFVFFT
ncbi:hypothetical protein DL770_009984 [Monosporascus sp. CRB-9-2]|nr:hypothetical protein DL770_009984 [Monosporascus sp. CRB-9-2]